MRMRRYFKLPRFKARLGCQSLKLKEYLIVALPFAQSDATAEYTEFGVDEVDALKQFRAKNPMFRVKEVTEK